MFIVCLTLWTGPPPCPCVNICSQFIHCNENFCLILLYVCEALNMK